MKVQLLPSLYGFSIVYNAMLNIVDLGNNVSRVPVFSQYFDFISELSLNGYVYDLYKIFKFRMFGIRLKITTGCFLPLRLYVYPIEFHDTTIVIY